MISYIKMRFEIGLEIGIDFRNKEPIQKNPNERVILKVPIGSKVTSTNANKSEIIINFINKTGNEEVFVFSRDNGSLLNKYLIKERGNDFKD